MLERFVDLPGTIFIHTIAIDSADDDAMNFGDALEQAVSFKIKYQAQLLEVLVSRRNDEGFCEPLEHPARIGVRFQRLGRFQRPPCSLTAILDWRWRQRRSCSSFVNAGERHCCAPAMRVASRVGVGSGAALFSEKASRSS